MITTRINNDLFSNKVNVEIFNKWQPNNTISYKKVDDTEIQKLQEDTERQIIIDTILALVKQRYENYMRSEGFSEVKLKTIGEINEYIVRLKHASYRYFINTYFDYIEKRLFELRPNINSRFYENYMAKYNDMSKFLKTKL